MILLGGVISGAFYQSEVYGVFYFCDAFDLFLQNQYALYTALPKSLCTPNLTVKSGIGMLALTNLDQAL